MLSTEASSACDLSASTDLLPMKAVILVGGYGTRLRPFTFTQPKPLVPFCNMPIVEHQVKALVTAGVDHIIFAVAYKAEAMEAAIKQMESTYNVTITCCKEETPLGTAGPIKNAEPYLLDGPCEDFFVCNSDVTCEFPLAQMLRFHRYHKAEGTILTTKVDQPQHYGVICTDKDQRVQSFVEKPSQFVGDDINAGVYILRRSVLKRIQLRPTSIEREIFPEMARDRQLFVFSLTGFWADLGRPDDLIRGMKQKLASMVYHGQLEDVKADSVTYIGNCLVDPSAEIGSDCVVGPDVVIGPGVVVGRGCRLQSSLIFKDAKIGPACHVTQSVIGWGCRLRGWNNVQAVLGENVTLQEGVVLRGTTVLPHKTIDADEFSGAVMM